MGRKSMISKQEFTKIALVSAAMILMLVSIAGAGLTNPSLHLEKIAAPTTYDDDGQSITYIYTVTNSGNVTIEAPINVTDDELGTISIQSIGTLSPGSSVTGTATYKTKDPDIYAGSVTNFAYATGSFGGKIITSLNNVIAVVPYENPDRELWWYISPLRW